MLGRRVADDDGPVVQSGERRLGMAVTGVRLSSGPPRSISSTAQSPRPISERHPFDSDMGHQDAPMA